MYTTKTGHIPAADSAAVVSTSTAASTWLLQIGEFLHLGASAVAILAGLTATWWHIEKALGTRRERKRLRREENAKRLTG